jgi:uncharacterized protein (DUF169 family)
MKSTLLERLQLTFSPVAIHLTDEKPEGAIQFKEGNIHGCTAPYVGGCGDTETLGGI